ncbi:hypothetical protein [Streptomyces sp. NBC_01358]|uniref:hypothetical protein n=1 Tax=Streptomyces sp. NBC_01358 TaxID=2903837 RepID=UPI002E3526C4|nr:hypothetical protein [Streptomyces sp. NBC_01358]
MRSYAYSVLMLLHFLLSRDADLLSATETGLREFRLFRQDEAEKVVDDAAWDRDWAAVEPFYQYLIWIAAVAQRPWRATPQRSGLGSGFRPGLRVRRIELDQYLHLWDVGCGMWGSEGRLRTPGWMSSSIVAVSHHKPDDLGPAC